MTQNVVNILNWNIENYPCEIIGYFMITDAPIKDQQVVAIYDSAKVNVELIKLEKLDNHLFALLDRPPLLDYSFTRIAIVNVATDVEINSPGNYSFIYGGGNPANSESFIGEKEILRFDVCRHIHFKKCRIQSTDLSDVPGNRAVFLYYTQGFSLNDATVIAKHALTTHRSRGVNISDCDTSLCRDSILGHGTGSEIDIIRGDHFAVESGSGDRNYTLGDEVTVECCNVAHLKCVGPSRLHCYDVGSETLLGISTPWGDPVISSFNSRVTFPDTDGEGDDAVSLVSLDDTPGKGIIHLEGGSVTQRHTGPGRKCIRAVLDAHKGFITWNGTTLVNTNGTPPTDIKRAEASIFLTETKGSASHLRNF